MLSNRILKEYFATGPKEKGWGDFEFSTKTYKDNVMSQTLQILFDINEIGEKSFSKLDDGVERFKQWVDEHSEEFDEAYMKFENAGERVEFCAEYCYSKFFKNNNILAKAEMITESKKKFDAYQKEKIKLTDEERDEAMGAGAVWHHGPNGQESCAIWKSKDKSGKITYHTHTHRCWQTASTLKGAIKKYHDVVKETA